MTVEELSYGNAVQSLSKIHLILDIVGSLVIRPVPKPDLSGAEPQEQALTTDEGFVALRPSGILEAVIQATNNALRSKRKPKKGEVPEYHSALYQVFLSASSPLLVLRGRYKFLPGAISRDASIPNAKDQRCSTKVEPFSRACIPMFALRQWENMAHLGLHIGTTLDHVFGGLASLVKDSPQKAISSPEELKAVASALMLRGH